MFSSIVTAIIALAKAIPAIRDMLEMIITQWIDYRITKIENDVISINEERTIILNQLSKAKTNEERIAFARALKRIS